MEKFTQYIINECNQKVNKYIIWYEKLILKRQKYIIKNNDYNEVHHIIPVSLKGNNEKSNLIKLTAREHYIAHALLAKATELPSMIKALHKMMFSDAYEGRNYKINSHMYEYCRQEHSKIVSKYSKNTVTAYDNILNKTWRVPSELFHKYKDIRFIALKKGSIRSDEAKRKTVETIIPYVLEINGEVIIDGSISKILKNNTGIIQKIYFKTFNISKLTSITRNRYSYILNQDLCNINAENLTKLIYEKIKVYPKLNKTHEDIILFFTKNKNRIKSELQTQSSKKSRESRTKYLYITPTGKFNSKHDLIQEYPWIENLTKQIYHNNIIVKQRKKSLFKYPEEWIGESWNKIGFYVFLKTDI